jgi:sec-independent protein translocase protein TatB
MGVPPTIQVASLGMWDSLILMVMALVVFGPRRLPEIGRKMGRIMYELRKASNDFKFQMEEELRKVDEVDQRKKEEARLAALTTPAQTGVDAQLPNSEIGAPSSPISESETSAVNGSAPVESPYPGEVVYPTVITDEAKTTEEETASGTQLPSTGQTVPAAQNEIPAENDANIAASTPAAKSSASESMLMTEQPPHA